MLAYEHLLHALGCSTLQGCCPRWVKSQIQSCQLHELQKHFIPQLPAYSSRGNDSPSHLLLPCSLMYNATCRCFLADLQSAAPWEAPRCEHVLQVLCSAPCQQLWRSGHRGITLSAALQSWLDKSQSPLMMAPWMACRWRTPCCLMLSHCTGVMPLLLFLAPLPSAACSVQGICTPHHKTEGTG